MSDNVKDYLGYENHRNKEHATMYQEMIRRAFGDVAVIIGHHLTFERDGDLETENEIPSADTLMFCHDVMGRLFGPRAVDVMRHLASVPVEERDEVLEAYLHPHPHPTPSTVDYSTAPDPVTGGPYTGAPTIWAPPGITQAAWSEHCQRVAGPCPDTRPATWTGDVG